MKRKSTKTVYKLEEDGSNSSKYSEENAGCEFSEYEEEIPKYKKIRSSEGDENEVHHISENEETTYKKRFENNKTEEDLKEVLVESILI